MNANPQSRDRKQVAWPVAGILIGAAVSINPFYAPRFTLNAGIAVWCVAMLLVLLLPAHPIGARIGMLLAGLFLAVPCFVRAAPLLRVVLMCCMFVPFVAAAALVAVPPIASLRARLSYLFSWGGTRVVTRRARSLDAASLLQLIVATVVLAAAIAAVKAIPASGVWLLGRWLAGGIMVLAFAEMATAGLVLLPAAFGVTVPPLMRSPYRSASVGEFWTKRWNIFASEKVFRPCFFAPLARRSPALGLFTAFAFSGVAHALLADMAIGKWGISLIWGAFFLVQPLFIAAERWMNVRRWRLAARRVWTLSALAITSPLFVEPALRLMEQSWGAPDVVFPPTLAAFGFVMLVCGVISLASLASRPGDHGCKTIGVSGSAAH